MSLTVIDTPTATEVEVGAHTLTVSTLAIVVPNPDAGSLAAHVSAADPHPQYMAELLYDPSGKKTDCFDISNQNGSLDAGTFA